MVIMWPNRDGTVTLSQRMAIGEVEPELDLDPPALATLLPKASSAVCLPYYASARVAHYS